MLTESFIAASASPPKLASSSSAALKDAGIFFHNLQPQPGLKTSYKKSATAPNCCTLSTTHIFAAQADKAIIHVYDRSKGAQEATASFQERITSITLIRNFYLAIGFQNGAISVWEILTGRSLTTAQAHLQPVTSLAASSCGNYLFSAGPDSTVLVWLLSDILDCPSLPPLDQQVIKPVRTLAAHRAAVTALGVGHSSSGADILVSASKDRTAILWDYQSSSEPLATYLLPEAPLSLTLDPADRAIFASYADGSVQCIDILSPHYRSGSTTTRAPLQPPKSTIWSNPSSAAAGPATALALSYDATTLLTGHVSGKIYAWSVADKRLHAEVADYPGAAITNLTFVPPTGLSVPRSCPTLLPSTVTKPRVHEPFSGTAGSTALTGTYAVHAQLLPLKSHPRALRSSRRRTLKACETSSFAHSIHRAEGLTAAEMEASLHDMSIYNSLIAVNTASTTTVASEHEADFMALDGQVEPASQSDPSLQSKPLTDINEALMSEVFSLQRERTSLLREREIYQRRKRRKELRRADLVDDAWAEATGSKIRGLPANVGREWAEAAEQRTGQRVKGVRWQSGSELSSDSDDDDEHDVDIEDAI